MNHLHRLIFIINLLLLCPTLALAKTSDEYQPNTKEISIAFNGLPKIERQLTDSTSRIKFRQIKDQLHHNQSLAEQCIKKVESELDRLNKESSLFQLKKTSTTISSIEQDGASTANIVAENNIPDSRKITQQKKHLEKQQIKLKETLIDCKRLAFYTEQVRNKALQLKNKILTRQIFSVHDNIFEVVTSFIQSPKLLPNTQQLSQFSQWLNTPSHQHKQALIKLGSVFIASLLIGFIVRWWIKVPATAGHTDIAWKLYRSFLACFRQNAPLITAFSAIVIHLNLQPVFGSQHAFRYTMEDVLALILIFTAIQIVLRPCKPAENFQKTPQLLAKPLARSLKILATLLLTAWLLPEYSQGGFITETGALVVVYIINILNLFFGLRVFALLGRIKKGYFTLRYRHIAVVLLLSSLLVSFSGYHVLGNLLMKAAILTPVMVATALLLMHVQNSFFDGFIQGKYRWQNTLLSTLNINKGKEPGLISWLRYTLSAAIWLGLLLVLLHIWGLSEAGTSLVVSYVFDGFDYGDSKIVPARIFLALVGFNLFLALVRWLKKQLDGHWLANAQMDAGAREALVTTFGYTATAIAIFLSLSVAGFDLANLAIVAGALSVGIGFGLQNIVNNFISGLILLVERPISKGNWVVVGDTEGRIKKISIRSTLIQTFDGSVVIVPNSELISGQVTNWTLRDLTGRVKAPIGIAYGSDVRLAEKLLIELAEAHPMVIKDNLKAAPPNVIFNDFGDSSINLELRCNIKDINMKKRVLSDLNFAIEEKFSNAGIVIPFQQRDINCNSPIQVELK